MLNCNHEQKMLRLDLQFFGDDGAEGDSTASAEGTATANKTEENTPQIDEATRRFIQSEVDRLMADERKNSATLKKENEKLKKEKMTADELKKYEDEQKAKQLEDREKAITDRENRYYALNAVLKADIGVDSAIAEEVVSLVLGSNSDEIDGRIATLTKVVNKLSANKVDSTFKANGRTPKGASGNGEETKKTESVAEKLGKQTAETNKQASSVLNSYLGGNK